MSRRAFRPSLARQRAIGRRSRNRCATKGCRKDAMMLDLAAAIRDAVHPLTGAAGDYDSLIDLSGDARFVLIGEASHGTHEFYRQRALITRRLIAERGFRAVAVEADWPDAYLIN